MSGLICGQALGSLHGVGGQQAGGTLLRKSIHKDLVGWALPSCLPSQAQTTATWSLKLELVAGPSLCWMPEEEKPSECEYHVPDPLAPKETAALFRHFPEFHSFPTSHMLLGYPRAVKAGISLGSHCQAVAEGTGLSPGSACSVTDLPICPWIFMPGSSLPLWTTSLSPSVDLRTAPVPPT